MPRCLCSCTRSTKEPSRIKGGELKRYLFSEKIKSLLFEGLKITLHIFAHLLSLSRSRFRIWLVSAGSLPETKQQVSSTWPFSKQLLKTLDSENKIGVAMIFMNFPEIPQWELFDF